MKSKSKRNKKKEASITSQASTKTIYILLTRSTTIVSRIVHMMTLDRYTHVSLIFDEEMKEAFSSSRKNGRTMFPAGPCPERFYEGYLRHHPEIPCMLLQTQISDASYHEARRRAFLLASGDNHFNILGLALCRLNISYERPKHFFCSQFVAEILSKSGAMVLPKKPPLMRPIDYMTLPQLTCVYEGSLGELMRQTEEKNRSAG